MTVINQDPALRHLFRPLSLLRRKAGAMRDWLRLRREQRMARAAFHQVLLRDDKMLRDMGLTRADVLWAASLPLEHNAALEARAAAERRRRLDGAAGF